MAEPYSTVDEALDASLKDEDHLGLAADMVVRLAPPPDPVTTEYEDKAGRAERLLFRYLKHTDGGTITSKALSGVASRSFANDVGVRRILRDTMGGYYRGVGMLRFRDIERG